MKILTTQGTYEFLLKYQEVLKKTFILVGRYKLQFTVLLYTQNVCLHNDKSTTCMEIAILCFDSNLNENVEKNQSDIGQTFGVLSRYKIVTSTDHIWNIASSRRQFKLKPSGQRPYGNCALIELCIKIKSSHIVREIIILAGAISIVANASPECQWHVNGVHALLNILNL